MEKQTTPFFPRSTAYSILTDSQSDEAKLNWNSGRLRFCFFGLNFEEMAFLEKPRILSSQLEHFTFAFKARVVNGTQQILHLDEGKVDRLSTGKGFNRAPSLSHQ